MAPQQKAALAAMDKAGDPIAELRAAIAQGHYLPNEHLVETDFCRFFGTNRSVIRAVFAKLEQEGLVVREKNRGTFVRRIEIAEAIEVLEARCVIEALATRYAALRATLPERRQLRKMHAELARLEHAGDIAAYLKLNERMHTAILRMSRHAVSIRLLTSLNSQVSRYRGRSLIKPGRLRSSVVEHARIVDAICDRDGSGAETAMREHLSASMTALSEWLPEAHM
jgi:DNA-binding GntR family transcriptional regulator